MKKLIIVILSLACTSQYVLAATTLNWPSSGGIEEWGFARPYSCAPDDQYIMQLANRMHEQSNWGSVNGVYNAKSGEYTYGRTGQQILQAKGNAQAIAALQEDLDKIKAELNQLDNDAKSYIQLTSSGYQNGGDVIKAIKRFEVIGQNCINMEGSGDSNAIACGLQAKAFQITANLERFIQISCHLGGNVPAYAQASMPNNKVSSINAPDSSSSASSNSAGKTILKGLAAAIGVYTGVQEAKSNSRSRNSGSSQPAHQATTQTSQNRSGGSGKSWIVDEATHCLHVISAVDERRCGRSGGYEFTVKNSCAEEIKYTLPLWSADGKFRMLKEVHTVRPNSTGVVWACDLNGQYGKYMSACFTRNWLKTCSPLTDSDYDENGNLITQ